MSMKTTFSPQEITRLREEADGYVGKKVIIDNLKVPGIGEDVPDAILNTHDRVAAVVSEVELFPYLQEGTKYKKLFGTRREPGRIFAFPVQYGFPSVSVVLREQEDAIAVIKKLIDQDGNQLPWSAMLGQLGLDHRQFKNFTEIADGILTTRSNAQIRFENLIEDEDRSEFIQTEITERPKKNVSNLDAAIRLSRETRTILSGCLRLILEEGRQDQALHSESIRS